MKNTNRNSGFTLAELLIVIAIIAALIAIAIPIFHGRQEKANQAVDMTTMRAAYAELSVAHLDGKAETDVEYYYDPSGAEKLTLAKPSEGYGKSKTHADQWWTGVGNAIGIPNHGAPGVLRLSINASGVVTFIWGNYYKGLNIMDASAYNAMKENGVKYTEKQKGKTQEFVVDFVERDKILLDSLQDVIRNMSFEEFQALYSELKPHQDGSNKKCYVLSYSTIDSGGNSSAQIFASDLFQKAGFDYQENGTNYVINSVDNSKQTIWVNLGVTDIKNLTAEQWEKIRDNTFTYLKSGGSMTPNALRDETRKP